MRLAWLAAARARSLSPGWSRASSAAGSQGDARQLLGQPGLADPRLTDAEDEAPGAGASGIEPGPEGVELAAAAEDALGRDRQVHTAELAAPSTVVPPLTPSSPAIPFHGTVSPSAE